MQWISALLLLVLLVSPGVVVADKCRFLGGLKEFDLFPLSSAANDDTDMSVDLKSYPGAYGSTIRTTSIDLKVNPCGELKENKDLACKGASICYNHSPYGRMKNIRDLAEVAYDQENQVLEIIVQFQEYNATLVNTLYFSTTCTVLSFRCSHGTAGQGRGTAVLEYSEVSNTASLDACKKRIDITWYTNLVCTNENLSFYAWDLISAPAILLRFLPTFLVLAFLIVCHIIFELKFKGQFSEFAAYFTSKSKAALRPKAVPRM
jgi:hypothetical protein